MTILTGPVTITFPKNPIVGEYFMFTQNDYSTFLYVYDGCRWLLVSNSSDTFDPPIPADDPIEAYDRAMGVI